MTYIEKHNKLKNNLRKTIMKAMDDYIREVTNDEELIEVWLTYAIPDGADPEEFDDFADDDELWQDCIQLFHKIVKADENEDDE